MKKGKISSKDEFALLQSIHVTPGGGEVNLSQDHVYTGNLLGRGALVKTGKGILTLAATSPNFTGQLVLSGGTVSVGVNQALATEAGIVFDGGTFGVAGITQEFSTPLSVQKNSILSVNGGTSLRFADSSGTVWKKSILAIQGTPGANGIRFGSSASALTAMQLSQIRFPSGRSARLTSDGYLTTA